MIRNGDQNQYNILEKDDLLEHFGTFVFEIAIDQIKYTLVGDILDLND